MYEENVQDFNLTSVAKPVGLNTHKHTHSQHFNGELSELKNSQTGLSFFLLLAGSWLKCNELIKKKKRFL